MGPKQALPIRVSVNPGVSTMKGFSTFLKSLGPEPHYQTQISVNPKTLFGVQGLSLLKNTADLS